VWTNYWYTKYILAFFPGNGFDGAVNWKLSWFYSKRHCYFFIKAFNCSRLQNYAIIGGSVGGGIAWEMVALEPTIS
jgi:homoserine O-acetyltransferase